MYLFCPHQPDFWRYGLILNVMPETHFKQVRMGPGKLLCLDGSKKNFVQPGSLVKGESGDL